MQTYVAVYDSVPEKWEDARPMLVEILRRLTSSSNAKEIGSFLNMQLLTGRQFIPGTNINPNLQPNEYRDVFRMVIDFGALPNAGTKSVAHNITAVPDFSVFTLVNLYLSATDAIAFTSFSLQYWSVAPGDIVLSLTSTNIVVTTASDYSNFTRSFCVIEYMLQV